MTMKKKIVIVALVVCIFAMSIASATLAYFTDTETATNKFTVGDVEIKLTEVNQAGNEVTADETGLEVVYDNIFPGNTIIKKPTIVNSSTADDANEAFVAAIITLDNGKTGDDAITSIINNTNLTTVLTNLVADGDAYSVKTTIADGKIIISVIAKTAIVKDGKVQLFENVVVPATWDHAEMDKFATLSIKVDAYATQTNGFDDDAVKAITTAFDGKFDSHK